MARQRNDRRRTYGRIRREETPIPQLSFDTPRLRVLAAARVWLDAFLATQAA